MLPRPVVTLIALALTVMELLNVIGQVFLGSGDSAFHIAYPAVLGALGLVAKPKDDDAPPGGVPDDPPTPVAPRHRRRREA